MTMHDVRRLISHWNKNPPLRVLVRMIAASLGVKIPDPQEAGKSVHMNERDVRALMARTGGRIPGVGSA